MNEDESTVIFNVINEDCMKISPLIWKKQSCASDKYIYNVCTDENCQNCVERQIADDECIADDFMKLKCDTMENISNYVDMSKATHKVSVFKSEGEQPQCEENNVEWMMYLIKDKCSQLMENFYLKSSAGDNDNQVKLQFFKNAQCSEPFEMLQELPVDLNQCIVPEWIPAENIAVKIEKVEQQ